MCLSGLLRRGWQLWTAVASRGVMRRQLACHLSGFEWSLHVRRVVRRWVGEVRAAIVQFVVQPVKGAPMAVELPRGTTVAALAALLEARCKPPIPQWAFQLRIHGRVMRPERSLASCGLQDGDVLCMALKGGLRGGMEVSDKVTSAGKRRIHDWLNVNGFGAHADAIMQISDVDDLDDLQDLGDDHLEIVGIRAGVRRNKFRRLATNAVGMAPVTLSAESAGAAAGAPSDDGEEVEDDEVPEVIGNGVVVDNAFLCQLHAARQLRAKGAVDGSMAALDGAAGAQRGYRATGPSMVEVLQARQTPLEGDKAPPSKCSRDRTSHTTVQ